MGERAISLALILEAALCQFAFAKFGAFSLPSEG